MSRIGKRELVIPNGVTVTIDGDKVTISGKLGTLELIVPHHITVNVVDGKVLVSRANDAKTSKQLHGTTNANISNMLIGVSEGFKRELEIIGVGYKFTLAGNNLSIAAGYSHPVVLQIPSGIKVEAASATEIAVSGYDKQAVGEFSAIIRKVRQPEPYKGKGIRYKDEHVRRKEGKKAA